MIEQYIAYLKIFVNLTMTTYVVLLYILCCMYIYIYIFVFHIYTYLKFQNIFVKRTVTYRKCFCKLSKGKKHYIFLLKCFRIIIDMCVYYICIHIFMNIH